jgi:hypothetical protein
MTERDNKDTSGDAPETDLDNDPDASVPHRDNISTGCLVKSLELDGDTLLFNIEDDQRWLQSDTAVVLADAI